MEFIKKYYKYIIIFIMGIFIGLMINIPSCTQPKTEYIEIHDTINKERIVNNTQIKIKKDTTFIIDSILIKGDTIYVTTPIEYKVYKDTKEDDTYSVLLSTASAYKFSKDVYHSIFDDEVNANDDVEYMYKLNEKTNVKIPKAVDNIENFQRREEEVITKEDMRNSIIKYIEGRK